MEQYGRCQKIQGILYWGIWKDGDIGSNAVGGHFVCSRKAGIFPACYQPQFILQQLCTAREYPLELLGVLHCFCPQCYSPPTPKIFLKRKNQHSNSGNVAGKSI